MFIYILRRALATIPTLLGLITLVFFLMRLLPGDPVGAMLTEFAASARDQERLREQLGLNDPLIVQYGKYMLGVVQGDLGRSFSSNRKVTEQIVEQLPATLELALASTFIGVVGGVTLGILAAVWRGSLFDRLSMLISLFFISMPSFWVGIVMIYLFALQWKIFPTAGTGGLQYLALPALALGLRPIASLSRLVRASLLEVLQQEYVMTARAKGLPGPRVVLEHALRNALIPVITVIGIQFGYALGGAVIVETVFGRQGIGLLAVDAIRRRDYLLVQGLVLFVGIVFVAANLIVDLLYAVVDPRIRYA